MTATAKHESARKSATLSGSDEGPASVHKSKKKTQLSGHQSGRFLRSELVGKFPNIQHRPAPAEAQLKLSQEIRDQILAQMVLR